MPCLINMIWLKIKENIFRFLWKRQNNFHFIEFNDKWSFLNHILLNENLLNLPGKCKNYPVPLGTIKCNTYKLHGKSKTFLLIILINCNSKLLRLEWFCNVHKTFHRQTLHLLKYTPLTYRFIMQSLIESIIAIIASKQLLLGFCQYKRMSRNCSFFRKIFTDIFDNVFALFESCSHMWSIINVFL